MNGAVISIFFDTDSAHTEELNQTKIEKIDNFFNSLKLDNMTDGKVVDKIELRQLMMDVVDFGSRWAYQGSLTAPPCSEKIYWNVVRAVYPIKKEALAKFNQLLSPDYSPVEDA